MHQLRTEGVLKDLTKIEALPSVARRYVITDAGWNLLDFAAQLHALTSGSLQFRTLPIQGYATIDGQSANVVNSATIQAIVQAAFYPKPGGPGAQASAQGAQPGGQPAHGGHHQGAAARRKITADVLNGGYTAGLAGRVSAVLKKAGYRAGQVGDTSYRTTTEVLYGSGAPAGAGKIAAMFGVPAVPSGSVASGHVEVLLAASATVPQITASAKPQASSAVVVPNTGPQGGAVGGKGGIPCVN